MCGELADLKGVYVLVLRFLRDVAVNVGSLGEIAFKFGYYGYVGSGMGRGMASVFGRVRRHLSRRKLRFWHIDYVTCIDDVKVVAVFFAESDVRLEHAVSKALKAVGGLEVKGFGSSDCDEKCGSHLFFVGNSSDEAFEMVFKAFRRLGIEPRVFNFAP